MSVKERGFAEVMRVEKAYEIFSAKAFFQPETEIIQVVNSMDRILAQQVVSKVNLPGFRRSAMDGYAIIANDSFGASETNPITLALVGVVEIGDKETPSLISGQAIRISTGAPLPSSATAVVRLEDCERISDTVMEIFSATPVGKNVANEDEDVKTGQILFNEGHLVKPWDLAILLSINLTKVKVRLQPKIGILSTGNELIPSGNILSIGEVVDSNRPAINAWITKVGAIVSSSRQVIDDPKEIKNAILDLASMSDLIITTGGTSVGSKDFLPEVIESVGDLLVHGIAIRPGKPVALGIVNFESPAGTKNIPMISLPGYPLAAFINFDLFVTPLLSKWTKIAKPWDKTTRVKLNQKIPSASGMIDFVRLRKASEGVDLIRITGAGILSSIVTADYILEIPEDIEGYPEGTEVSVRVLRSENE